MDTIAIAKLELRVQELERRLEDQDKRITQGQRQMNELVTGLKKEFPSNRGSLRL
jgi:hypothetical protein